MLLTKCRQCGTFLSSIEKKCPKCNCEQSLVKKGGPVVTWQVVVIALGGLAFLGAIAGGTTTDGQRYSATESYDIPSSYQSADRQRIAPASSFYGNDRQESEVQTDFSSILISVARKYDLRITSDEARDVKEYAAQATKQFHLRDQDILAGYLALRISPNDPHSHMDAILNLDAVFRGITNPR